MDESQTIDGSTHASAPTDRDERLRRTIRQLSRREQYYASLFTHHPDPAFSLDCDGRFTSVNAAAARIAGLREQDLLGLSFRDIVAAESLAQAETAFAEALTGAPQTAEMRCRGADGAPHDVRATIVPIVIDGVVEGVHGIAKDITALKRTLERLHLLEACIGGLNDIVMIAEVRDSAPPSASICYVNPAFERVTGYTAHEVLGRSALDLWREHVGDDTITMVRQRLRRNETVRIELYKRKKDGQPFWTEVDIVPVAREPGPPHYFVSLERDITERKRQQALEAELSRQQRAITEAALHVLRAEDLDSVIQKITDTAREIVGAHQAVTSIVGGGDWTRARTVQSLSEKHAAYAGGDPLLGRTGLCVWAAARNAPVRMTHEELTMHPRWREADAAGALPMRGWLAAPLVDRNGQNVGLVQLTDPYGSVFTEQDEALLVQLAQLASVAVENARLIEELASAEAQYRSIFRNALEGIVRCTGAGVLLAANPSFAYLLGFRDLPALLLSVRSFAEVFDDPQEWSRLSEFLKGERAVTGYVARLRRADGGAIWAMLSLRSEWLDGTGVIEGMVQDVTDRHESEARIRALNAELEERVAARTRELAESESLQRTLMDVAPQIVWVSACDGEVRYFNRRWHQVTGRPPEESLGWGWLDSVHPDDVAQIRASWAEAVGRAGRFELACRIRHADGSYRHYLYVAHPVVDRDGSVSHWVGISADVSDLKNAEEALAQSNRELEAFSYSVSHDLRTPLHAIAGFSGALLRSYRNRLDRDAVHYLERISANCARMAQQIEEILNLARVSRVELRRQPVSLSALAEQCVRNLQSASPGREPQVLIQPGLTVEGDPALLRLVIENLLGNAWKFTSKRADARIELRGTQRPGEQCFSVCDNGVGFDMAHAGKLFGVFQRLHHVSEFPGTGVGLATVRRIVERHRGRVWAEAAPGQGACFYFTLPVA